ncbi:MAG: hypothetical protein WCQ72_03340 [Eubacteriales bacterium]
MSGKFTGGFYWNDINNTDTALSAAERYHMAVEWAGKARGQNPNVFDALTEWILDDSEWSEDKLADNHQIIMRGVLGRFKEQNSKLRAYLKELEPSGVVNEAVFGALDRFDEELSGKPGDKRLTDVVASVFADFSVMRDREVRKQFAGNKTGAYGTDSVEIFGYVNYLKDCDAGVQWALFMPDSVKRQQDGFIMDSFEYKKMPGMRFIGKECIEHDSADMSFENEIMSVLGKMSAYKTELDFDVLFQHHYGLGVDKGQWHGFWGRFMKAGTPVPEGFIYFDFIPERDVNNYNPGPPYLSQFAYAAFSGGIEAMHNDEGTDGGRMYDVTRNKILADNVNIPYPDKYWTAEVFPDGCGEWSTAYMFSAEW